ncbi:MAG: polysaccharide deacetylase family protein, partial [Lachnospiraceae bacterium]|nr:polysaccharide deacetylase family protein [Lachnospiraceae bacterium]
GYAEKAVLDSDGNVKCRYVDANGVVNIGDYDVVPRLNTFLEAHPDAAYKGARGMIAMTGYNGVFGYRTDAAYRTGENLDADQRAWLEAHPDFNWDEEVKEAQKIAEAVKASGWEFACHTWGHLSVTNASVETLMADHEKWKNTVANITGPTDTIIFAHGNDIGSFRDYTEENEKYAYYKGEGYRFYANVDASTPHWLQIRQNYLRQGRIDCDGLQMWRSLSGQAKTNVFEGLFDVKSVFDETRPTPVTASGKA